MTDQHSKKEYINKQLKIKQWDKMGYWESAGKGQVFINTAPGESLGTLQGILLFFAVIALLSKEVIALLVLTSLVVLLGWLKHYKRRLYLKKEYEKNHNSH